MDNNEEGKVFDLKEIKTLSRKALDAVIVAATASSIEAENDPN